MNGVRRTICFLAVVLLAGTETLLAADADDPALWQRLASGSHIALMRHALAPGTGDPANFKVEDCSTQRLLSEQGRDQARRIGARLRQHGVARARLYSSQWCRCVETAQLLGIGEVQPFDGLNSFFRDRPLEPQRTATTLRLIQRHDGVEPLVLVTHQVNINALTGEFAGSGDIVVVRYEGEALHVAGTIEAP